MYAAMRNSYLKQACGFEFNVLTRVLLFLHAPKRIQHIIKKKHQCLGSLKEDLIMTEYEYLQTEAVNVQVSFNSTKWKVRQSQSLLYSENHTKLSIHQEKRFGIFRSQASVTYTYS